MFDIISILEGKLPKFKTVLEVGSKKGENLETLNGYYEVVASEDEKVKTRYLKDTFIDIRVILIDKIELDTHKKVDCIYSNNVFDDCSLEEIKLSILNQKRILNQDGLIFHIFDETKISKEKIENLLNSTYELIESKSQKGSFYILARLT